MAGGASAAWVPAPEGADPEFPVPAGVLVELRGDNKPLDAGGNVRDEEFDWMLKHRPLEVFSQEVLAIDYGRAAASEMLSALTEAGFARLAPALHWPGVGTRWRSFVKWCTEQSDATPDSPAKADLLATPEQAFRGFGQSLGRVITYRALALNDADLGQILEENCIFPSGRLHVDAERLKDIVAECGVRTICVARLFIAHLRRLLGHDPSVSLHDDWQTATVIASGYTGPGRPVCLFELSCPRVESIGWTLQEVALQRDDVFRMDPSGAELHPPWFCFPSPSVPSGVWFDGRKQRTERFSLYGVPFVEERLRNLYVFPASGSMSIGAAVAPFVARQAQLHSAFLEQQVGAEERRLNDGEGGV